MEYAAITISVLALLLSGFTFYWASLREVRKLFLIRIDKVGYFSNPEFALVNGGSRDLLITSIECGFVAESEIVGCFYPAQIVNFEENDSMHLAAGKSLHCKVKFTEGFSASIIKEALRDENSSPPIYLRRFKINVSWVEPNGEDKRASVVPNKYGFSESGKIMSYIPLIKKYDLYKEPYKP